MEKNYYLYNLIDPNLNIPKYIGISCDPNRRFKDHLKDKSDTPKTKWIQKLKSGGQIPILKIVQSSNNINEIIQAEISAIAKCKDLYELTNSTLGGEYDKIGTPVDEYDMNGKYLATYSSMSEYCELHEWPTSWATSISAVCVRKRNYCYGRIFRYIGDTVTKEDIERLNSALHARDPKHFYIMSQSGKILGEFNSIEEATRQGFGGQSQIGNMLRNNPKFCSVQGNIVCNDPSEFEERLEKLKRSSSKGCHDVLSKYDLDGNYIATFYSYIDAARSVGKEVVSGIRACCKGKQAKAYEYQWKFGNSKENIGKYVKSYNTKNRVKKVQQFSKNGKFIKEWDSAQIASENVPISVGMIRECANGSKKSAGGYIWKYV